MKKKRTTKKFPSTPKGVKRIAVYRHEDFWILIGLTKDKIKFYRWDGYARLWNIVVEVYNNKNLL